MDLAPMARFFGYYCSYPETGWISWMLSSLVQVYIMVCFDRSAGLSALCSLPLGYVYFWFAGCVVNVAVAILF
jgi:hypothetical protein